MWEISGLTILSVLTGIMGHLAFYPVIEGWSNQRVQRLARPSIGVLLNAPVFVFWLWKVLEGKKNRVLLVVLGFFAYCTSFMWNGAGVALGYIIDDYIKGNKDDGH